MARNIFKGLGIALVTPFTADGEVDDKAIVRLVEYLSLIHISEPTRLQ